MPGETPPWLKLAGTQALVLWQLSHACVVGICVVGLPLAMLPLWQVEHVPGATPLWLKTLGGGEAALGFHLIPALRMGVAPVKPVQFARAT